MYIHTMLIVIFVMLAMLCHETGNLRIGGDIYICIIGSLLSQIYGDVWGLIFDLFTIVIHHRKDIKIKLPYN